MSSYKEPAAGWIDNLNGLAGTVVGLCYGILPVAFFRGEMQLDGFAIDILTKLTIVAAYKCGLQYLRNESVENGVEVVNCVAGDIFNLNVNGGWALIRESLKDNPMENALWYFDYPSAISCYYNFLFQMLFLNIPMAIVLDAISLFRGQNPMMMKISRRIVYTVKALLDFACKEYDMICKNMIDLEDYIPQSEVATYGTRQECLEFNFREYFSNYLRGIKYYILNEPPEATAAARRRAKILFTASRVMKTFAITLLILYLWSIVSKS